MIVNRKCPICREMKPYMVLHSMRKKVPICDDCYEKRKRKCIRKYQKTKRYKDMNRKRCNKWIKEHKEDNKKYQREYTKWKKHKIKMMTAETILNEIQKVERDRKIND